MCVLWVCDDVSTNAQIYSRDYDCICELQVKVWFQNRRMKFKRQSRGHVSHDVRSHVDSSPRRFDDDDDDDEECVDERRRVQGTSAVTSRSGSPAVDSTTTDYCSLTAGDNRTPTERSSEPPVSLLGSQQASLEKEEKALRCVDDAPRQDVANRDETGHVFSSVDQPAADLSADVTNQISGTTPVLAQADTVDVAAGMSSETENNLARLEIMTCIAGGNLNRPQNTAGPQLESAATLRPRRGGPACAMARSSRPAGGGRSDGRRARAAQSRTRSGALTAACSGGAVTLVISSAMSNYRRPPVLDSDSGDNNYNSDSRRESRDITRDLESTLAFQGGSYSDTPRCVYTDLTTNGRFPSEGYPASAVAPAYRQQPPVSYGTPFNGHFQSTVVDRSSSSPVLNCNVSLFRDSSDSFTSLPLPPPHSAASFPVCDGRWQTWKDWRWNDCASFPASAVDYDDDYSLVGVGGGVDHVNCSPSVDTRFWTNSGHDVRNDVIRTSFPADQTVNATTRRSQLAAAYWGSDCSAGVHPFNGVMSSYYEGCGSADSTCSRPVNYNCSSTAGFPPSASSGFYDSECCYVPASASLSATAAADGQASMAPRQSVYQSCKYSAVVDGQC